MKIYSIADYKGWGLKLAKDNFNNFKPEEDNMEYQEKFFINKAKQIFGSKFKKINKMETCYYTVTPTHNFILDFIDEKEKIFVCSSCSGHGFKFSPIIGDIIAQVITF